jgi:pimeloyl-ACP methyl ester carboxylesterase
MSVSARRVEEVEAAPIILVPGFWLGAWAWEDVADLLRADGHDVTALTLPGLESADADRSGISLNDHVQAIVKAIESAGRPAVLAVHSGAGASGYGASDRVPERIAEMVYVDSGPPSGPLDAEMEATELPLPSAEDLAAEENLDGLTDEQLETFRRRAIPEPAGPIRDASELRNDTRLDVPTTVICTGFTSEQVKGFIEQGYAWIAALGQLRNVTYVDLPTSHWPMWSRPKELAQILGEVAERHRA